ncbi:MAG: M28 family peptidase [Ignavibacteria bacterium]|nr:M28 family peptidase [Ignavibacteria bacterium]
MNDRIEELPSMTFLCHALFLPFQQHMKTTLFFIAISCLTSFLHADERTDRLQAHVKYLASETLEGRAPGTKGNLLAAEYIRDQFKKIGLKPYGNHDFFQQFSIVTDITLNPKGNALSVISQKKEHNLKLKNEFTPLGISDNGTAECRIVFAGYGISSPADKYDDYAGIDVNNAVVIVMRGAPEQDNPHGNLSQFASLRTKAMTAKEKGAKAMICVSGQQFPDSLLAMRYEQGGKVDGMLVLNALSTAIEKMLPSLSISRLDSVIKASKSPASVAINDIRMRLAVSLKEKSVNTSNVIAYLPGTDPNAMNETIVIGAHFDHLGWGGEGSGTLASTKEQAIHYGADDNASGTAGLIETAYALSKKPLKRPVMFIGFTAEERGLLGSAHFVKSPTIGLDSICMMMNMDMIGRLKDGKLNIGGIGTSSGFKPLLDSIGGMHPVKLSYTEDGFGPSDHASFYGKEKPVLFFFTGLHGDYHRPTDTWEKIQYDGESLIVNMILQTLDFVGNATNKPDYIKVKSAAQPGQAMSFKVSLGITPDYSDHPKGMRITGVREGGAGEKAGLIADDIIIKLGSTVIKNVYDYTFALGKFKAGDSTSITVLRGPREDKEVELQVMFPSKK